MILHKIVLLIVAVTISLQYTKSDDAINGVNNGLTLAKGLADMLKDGNFRESLQNLGKSIGPFLGALGPLVSFALAFIPGGDSAELAYMKKAFAEVNNKLDSLHAEFDDVKKMIDWSTIQVSYAEQEKRIRAMSEQLKLFMEAAPGIQTENQKNAFINAYDSDFQNSAQKLYDGIVNNDQVFTDNVIAAAVKFTENHRRKVQRFMLGLTQLLLKGVEVQICYYQMNYPENVDYIKNQWVTKMNNVKYEMEKMDRNVMNVWYDQGEKDIGKIAAKEHALSNRDFLNKLYEFLKDKYDWRYWFVLVYNDVTGGDKHQMTTGCDGYVKFRLNGRNLVAYSKDWDDYVAIDKTKAQKVMTDFEMDPNVQMYLTFSKNAEVIFKYFPENLRKYCEPYPYLGLVCWGCNVWFRGYNYYYQKIRAGGHDGFERFNAFLFD